MSKKTPGEILQTPKGTHDILPPDAVYWDYIRRAAEDIARFYGFRRIETPHIEKTDLFLRTLGETTDVIEKQMYSFKSRGGDALTLRPEGTASIARAYIQHGMHTLPQPVRLYYTGAFFRHENPQRGRYREFRQFGLEILGEEDMATDVLVIRLLYTILSELGFENIAVQVNSIGDEESRAAYRKELAAYYKRRFNALCKDCKRRLKDNPLRLLDCKEAVCIELREDAPQMIKSLNEGSKKRFKSILEFLDEGGIPYFMNPHLVRGLDYYTDTVFEIFVNSEDGLPESAAEELGDTPKPLPIAVASGGRYDGLVKMLGGKATPGVGGALGMDRIVMEMKAQNFRLPQEPRPRIFLVQLGPAAKKKAFQLLEEFRRAGVAIAESMAKDSIKSQLKIASKIEAAYALILGQREALDGTVIVRAMDTGIQETVFMKDAVETVKAKLKGKK